MISVLAALTLVQGAPARHGSERIIVDNKKATDEGMQFKEYKGNETESMFQTVKGDDLNITMQEANITTQGYLSEEVKL